MQVTDVVLGLAAGVGIDLEPGGKIAYYVEWSMGDLSQVDVTTGAVSTALAGLAFPQDVEVDWDRGQIFVSERTGPVSIVFPNEGKKTIATPGGAPHQLDLKKKGNQRFLYTVCFDSGHLVRIDPDASTMTKLASGLGHPVGIVVDEAQQFAYVTEQDSGALTQVELTSGIKKVLITGLIAPFFLAWDRDATGIFCVQRDPANNLVRLDLGSLTSSLIANGLAWRPSGVAPNGDDSLIYICADRALQVISKTAPPPIKPPIRLSRSTVLSSTSTEVRGSACRTISRERPSRRPNTLRASETNRPRSWRGACRTSRSCSPSCPGSGAAPTRSGRPVASVASGGRPSRLPLAAPD